MSVSAEILASQAAYAARPFAVRWVDSHCAVTHRFHTFKEAFSYVQNQWSNVQRRVAAEPYRASSVWWSYLETPTGRTQLAYVLLCADVSSY
jgi:hypothetical protein